MKHGASMATEHAMPPPTIIVMQQSSARPSSSQPCPPNFPHQSAMQHALPSEDSMPGRPLLHAAVSDVGKGER